MRAQAHTLRLRSRRVHPARVALRWTLAVLVVLVAGAAVLSILYAGSPTRLAEGVEIAGVDVGGLTPSEAQRALEQEATKLEGVPVVFTAGSKRFRIAPSQLG